MKSLVANMEARRREKEDFAALLESEEDKFFKALDPNSQEAQNYTLPHRYDPDFCERTKRISNQIRSLPTS